MDTIDDEERYQNVVYQVLRHCPTVFDGIDPKLLNSVESQLRAELVPRESSSSRRATPLKHHDNGSRVGSADSIVKNVLSPAGMDTRMEVLFRGFVITETKKAVYLSTAKLPLTLMVDETNPDIFLIIRRLSGGITNELFHVQCNAPYANRRYSRPSSSSDMQQASNMHVKRFSSRESHPETGAGDGSSAEKSFSGKPASSSSSVVVRVFGKETDRVISRESELFYQSLFLKTYVHGKNFLIYEFLTGYEPMPFTEMPAHAAKIAEGMAQFQIIATIAAKSDYGKPLLPGSDVSTAEGVSATEEEEEEVAGHERHDSSRMSSAKGGGGGFPRRLSRFDHENNYTLFSLTKWADLVTSAEIVEKVVPEKQKTFVDVGRHQKEECVWMLEQLKAVESDLNEGVCHNDLLCGNLMLSADSTNLKIIDFDYANRNYLLFDLANHFNEYTGLECDYARYFPDDDAIFIFVKYYRDSMRQILTMLNNKTPVFDRERELFWSSSPEEEVAVTQRWVKVCKLLSLASNLSWAVWSLLQEAISVIDVDFLDYSQRRFERYLETKEEFSVA